MHGCSHVNARSEPFGDLRPGYVREPRIDFSGPLSPHNALCWRAHQLDGTQLDPTSWTAPWTTTPVEMALR